MGRQVGINHGRIAPWHHLDHGHDPGGKGYLGKSHLPSQPAYHFLVPGQAITMEKDNGKAGDSLIKKGL